MKLHNTLTRSVDDFTALNGKTVGMYSCGPTVYDALTVGNWTAYVRWDVLARTLQASGYTLDWVMNITDVGHLVSDGDDGEDKLEKGARREGKTAWEVAEFYTKDFLNGLDSLNILVNRHNLVKATDHIAEQIKLIQTLESKGYTYIINDGVYFDSTHFQDYGHMARLDLEGQQAGKRVDIGQKKQASDFALWKLSPKGESRDMEWDSPWGIGFPGWHIECSAMAMKYLGETLDIHTGGIDHIPVHHTNEIAQSEAATGKQFVRYWVHGNFLQVNGTRIAKSLGNGYTLEDLIHKGFTATDFRMLILQSHYRTEANFSWEALEAAQNRLKTLQAFADLRFQPNSELVAIDPVNYTEYSSAVLEHLQNDLNTPKALEVIATIIDQRNEGLPKDELDAFSRFISKLDRMLGLQLTVSSDITAAQKELIAERQIARANKEWQTSDTIRDTLLAENINIRDTSHGPIWYRG
ncbi:MAG: cysteine--tRNA ligase [Candidatus Saccharimonadales bacterium]